MPGGVPFPRSGTAFMRRQPHKHVIALGVLSFYSTKVKEKSVRRERNLSTVAVQLLS